MRPPPWFAGLTSARSRGLAAHVRRWSSVPDGLDELDDVPQVTSIVRRHQIRIRSCLVI